MAHRSRHAEMVNNSFVVIFYTPRKTNVFGGMLELSYLSARPCVRASVYKILISVKALARVKSHRVTALVYPSFVRRLERERKKKKKIKINPFPNDKF